MKRWLASKLGRAEASAASAKPKQKRARASATFAASLKFENVERRFGDTLALADFSLDVAPGEVVCLLGPSGCGKSTLLRVAAGIERPTGGRILINDREVAGPTRFVPPERRSVGLMFQDFALFPHLSILDNVAFGLRSLPRADAESEAHLILSRVGLDRYADDFPHILSGGQQQRVALARAIVPRPAVMLMDEPFSGLDVQLRETMQEETLSLLRETRATSVIVTHHPEEALRLGDRIAVMSAGRIVQTGKAEDLYHHPRDLFVARLFSEINEIPIHTEAGEVSTPFGRLPAPEVGAGRDAVLCVRQRGIRLTEATRTSTEGLPGRVRDVKFLGDAARIEVATQGFDAPLLVRTAIGHGLVKGAEVRVSIDPADVLIFPAAE